MKNEEHKFHLKVTKFAGELDIAHAVFRGNRIEAVVRQVKNAKNEFELPLDVDIPASLQIWHMHFLNSKEGTVRFEGWAGLCINQEWFGHHCYNYVFVMDMKSRTGEGAFWLRR